MPEVVAIIGPSYPGLYQADVNGYEGFSWDLIDGRIYVNFDPQGRVCETSIYKDDFSVVMNRRFNRLLARIP